MTGADPAEILELFAEAQRLGVDEMAARVDAYSRRLEQNREAQRRYAARPEVRSALAQYKRLRRKDPAYRERERARRARWIARTGYKSPPGRRKKEA
jgi:hypothetical protein